jgi:hypothetical protein
MYVISDFINVCMYILLEKYVYVSTCINTNEGNIMDIKVQDHLGKAESLARVLRYAGIGKEYINEDRMHIEEKISPIDLENVAELIRREIHDAWSELEKPTPNEPNIRSI